MSATTADQTMAAPNDLRRIVVVSAGTGDPSTTRMLADRLAAATVTALDSAGTPATVEVVELAPLAVDAAQTLVTGITSGELQDAIERVAAANAVIAATPVYKAGISGLFKSFVDVLDNDLLIAKPVLLAATAGTQRHAMVVDEQLRPLFAFLRALPTSTSVFAAPEDWADPALSGRIRRAAAELTALITSGIEQRVANQSWSSYQHQFAGNANRAQRDATDIDLDTPLMRLATGGRGLSADPAPLR